jgi:adenylate cyclase
LPLSRSAIDSPPDRRLGWRRRDHGFNTTEPGERQLPIRTLRLASGLVLFTFLATHLTNHALGLVSLEAMERGREIYVALWRNPVGTAALFGALLTHAILAFAALYRRRHLRMPAWEAVQLTLGLCIPPLLASHVVGTRIATTFFGAEDPYSRVVLQLWVLAPLAGLRQLALIAVAWTHGCVGMHFWLRLRPWYPRLAPLFLALAVLLPVLAALGFVQGGREVAALARDPAWRANVLAGGPPPAARPTLDLVWIGIVGTYAAALAGVMLARAARDWRQRRRGLVRVRYPDGREVGVPPGLSVLEVSRLAGIPHASVCGGRGRCSTCRVRVRAQPGALPAPSEAEQRVLHRIGAPDGVRLACQLRPTGDVAVTPLLPPTATAADGAGHAQSGHEHDVTVLFADLRGFTRLAERKLPFDVVFFLNRYFEAVGTAIQEAGGVTNQFTGDGVMALFGMGAPAADGARRAVAAAAGMVRSVEFLSQALADELPEPLRIGIGVHTGPAVVGRMGFADATYLTAVGDTVHVAARLEALTKDYQCQLVVSETVAALTGLAAGNFPRHEVTLRNRREPLGVYVVHDAVAASALLAPGASARAGA